MSWPDMESLQLAAEVYKFRAPNKDETEEDYRNDLSMHVGASCAISGHEIRTKKGWNEWSDDEKRDIIRRHAEFLLHPMAQSWARRK